jgi:cell pole-organizing protein PopZ
MAETEEGQQDQSMEEILQSIKRIIAEEGDVNAENQDDASAEVLELTDMVEAEEPTPSLASASDPFDALFKEEAPAEPASTVAPEPTPEPTAAPEPEPAPQPAPPQVNEKLPEPVHAPEPAAAAAIAPSVDENLLSEKALRESAEALRSLASISHTSTTHPSAPLGFRSGQTVEDVVIEAIRPMLKEWLDSNLPAIVMRKVQHEVERISHELRDMQ